MSRERRENDAGNILRNLKQPGGVSRKLRQSREVALLPSVLFDGELPEFIVSSNSDAVLVATGQRMLLTDLCCEAQPSAFAVSPMSRFGG